MISDDAEAGTRPHDPYAALRHADYRLMLAGAVVASIGLEIQAIAIGWELYLRTNSAGILGLTGAEHLCRS